MMTQVKNSSKKKLVKSLTERSKEINELDKLLEAFIIDSSKERIHTEQNLGKSKTRRFFNKLERDKLIMNIQNDEFTITIEGILFYKKGGYKKSIKAEKRKRLNENIKFYFAVITVIGIIINILFTVSQ